MGGDKRFPASAKKLRKAREDGDVAKSREFTSGVTLCVGVAYLLTVGVPGVSTILHFFDNLSAINQGMNIDDVLVLLYGAASGVGLAFVPFFLVLFLTVIVVEVVQVGLHFSVKGLGFKFSKLDPVAGLKRVAGFEQSSESPFPSALFVEIAKSLIFLAFPMAIGWVLFRRYIGYLVTDSWSDPVVVWVVLKQMVVFAEGWMLAIYLVLGVGLWLYARHKQAKRLMMDIEELKREFKESDGDPEVKSMRKQLHQDLLRRGAVDGVRKARVVIKKENV